MKVTRTITGKTRITLTDIEVDSLIAPLALLNMKAAEGEKENRNGRDFTGVGGWLFTRLEVKTVLALFDAVVRAWAK